MNESAPSRLIPRPLAWGGRALLAFLFLLYLLGFPLWKVRPSFCIACRAEKAETNLFGLRSATEQETEFSRWFRDEVDPSHRHTWVPRGYCRSFGIPGVFGGYACYGGHQVAGISSTVQREIYEASGDPRAAGRLFTRLAGWDDEARLIWEAVMSTSNDDQTSDASSTGWAALVDWFEAGRPRPWDLWWEGACSSDSDDSGTEIVTL